MNVLVFQHAACEGLGALESLLRERGARIVCHRWFETERDDVPERSAVDFLIVLGGPMSVHDDRDYPWLVEEKAWIRRALDDGLPMLGICLGAQMIAEALGGSVGAMSEPEIGWFPVELTDAGRELFVSDDPGLQVLHWHGESFTLPPDAERLAGSSACAEQGFRYGRRVVGLQFHLEMRPEDVDELIVQDEEQLSNRRWIQDVGQIRANSAANADATRPWLRRLLSAILD